jgi:hypothetical protein
MHTQFYPLKKMVWPILVILCLFTGQAHAQRVYANSQTNSITGLCLLCSITSPGNPVNNTSLDDYSQFNITAGLLGVSMQQTLIFPSVSSIGCDSLAIGIGSGDALLSANLFGGVTVQTFNGSTANNDAHVLDSSVLRLLQNNTRAEILLHPTTSFDRVKLTLSSSLLGLLSGFRIYYAFRNSGKPANPVYTVPQGFVCGSQSLPVLNHQPGINYNVRIRYSYTVTMAVALDTSFVVNNKNTIAFPPLINKLATQADIYVQAVNPFTGCRSDSVHQIFIQGGYAGFPSVAADSVVICKGDSAVLHAFLTATTFGAFHWYNAPVGGQLLFTGDNYTVHPDTTTTYYVTAAFACEYPQRRPVKVIVTKLPVPIYTVPQGIVCGSQSLPILNHQPGINYNVRIKYTSPIGPVLDTSYTVIDNDTITTPVLISSYNTTADIYVQAIKPLTGCRSDSIHQVFIQGSTGSFPVVDTDSVTICNGDSATLHATAASPLMPIRWYNAPSGGTLLYTGNYYTVHPATTTIYYVTAAYTCEYPQRRPVTVIVNTCAARMAADHKFSPGNSHTVQALHLYPNPTIGEVKINSKQNLDGAQLSVFDLQGKEIKRTILNGNTFRLEGNSGLYMIKVVTRSGAIYQTRILLQK